MNELYERELRNTSINDKTLADYVKENYIPLSVIENIKANISDEMDDIAANSIYARDDYNNGYYAGLAVALEIVEKHYKKAR